MSSFELLVDHREHALLARIDAMTFPCVVTKENLALGDVVVRHEGQDLFICERKTFADLLSSIKDGRYSEQSYRLTHTRTVPLHHVVYIIEGIFSTLSPADRKTVHGAMISLQFTKGFSVVRTTSVNDTADYLLAILDKIGRDFSQHKTLAHLASLPPASDTPSTAVEEPTTQQGYCEVVKKVRKENVTKENIGSIVLCQIPGISATNAQNLMKPFGSFAAFYTHYHSHPEELDALKIETTTGKQHKISKTIVANIRAFLF